VKIEATSDTELWLVRSCDGWQLPIFVNACKADGVEGKVLIQPATSINSAKLTALAGVLGKNTHRGPTACWLIDADRLPSLAARAQGITPEYYERWPDQPNPDNLRMQVTEEHSDPALAEPRIDRDAEVFLREMVQRTAITDLPTARLVWLAICQEMARWLLERKRPIDLGFVRLQALPYRANWKQILMARLPKAFSLFRKPKEKRDAALAMTEFPAWLRSSRMMAFDPKHNIPTWTIDATVTKAWKQYVIDYEREGRAKYDFQRAQAWARQINKFEPDIVEIFKSFLEEVAIPCGSVEEGESFGSQIIRPYIPKGRVTGESPDSVATNIVYPDLTNMVIEDEQDEPKEAVVTSDESLQPVSTVQPQIEDMRNGRGNLLQQSDES